MQWFFNNEIIVIAFTIVIYFIAEKLQKKTGVFLLNPILVSVVIIISFLSVFNIDYETYHKGSKYIDFLLKPAVVALGVPLYLQLEKIKKQVLPIIISQLVGCIVGVVSVVVIAKLMGASKDIVYSLAPKSVTTPIAIEVSRAVGGIAPLTAAVVIVVGIFGAVFGYVIMKLFGVKNPIAQSLAIGNAAHALGTSRSMDISPNYGAMASIGLILNGVLTALLAPYILKVLSPWIDA
ncbi:MAG: LrgB family protein [Mesonia hippocampi]|uniref:Putative murein hydrolase (TIGR00659 family) n=1 Tax=Mesonia hippocampi TaxID=1628250 RepID=A0A840EJT5_9FLAO|nr:LrgB family protein [Mesonia hippocampi]MBB4119662.1 putative murein hydrolase (TIGR00659 family) [Mesonia hippocampi]